MIPDDLTPEDRERAQDKLARNWLYRYAQTKVVAGERHGDRYSQAYASRLRLQMRARERAKMRAGRSN